MRNDVVIVDKTMKVPVSKVWDACTDVEKLRQWFFNVNDFKPVIGFQFEATGKSSEGNELVHQFELTMVVTNKKLQYTFQFANYEGVSLVTIDFIEKENGSIIRLTHTGINNFPNTKEFANDCFQGGWSSFILERLPKFIESNELITI